ncbi:TPA: restriction endonuclease subunit S [Streptococcus suis]|uniref:restriction endonuclease subunit S n=1 Tax=Streptococcus suis TaxID=1307 RepID=UPI00209A828E|nr:restriction endonuclease subunit S [Streptococcus suis]MCO8206693.1 restriction endonuclease subunit S [Streptococcus suis]HEM3491147.1 restriction endonuclease subunit S [Streptococcus suis]
MPNKDRNIPKRRFKAFENADAWELRKLGEVATSFDYGLNSAATEYDGENKYLRITDIDDDSRGFNISDLTSPEIDLFGLDEYRLNIGDIVFARTGASVGKSYIYRSIDGKVYFAGFLIRAKIKDNFNPDFVFQNTLTANYERFISITSMRSGQPGVNAQEYSNYEFMVPSHPEQKAIGTFFSTLDQQITLHQRKLDKLKHVKQAYLSEMFPAEGERMPKRRFPGFTDAWELRKLKLLFIFKYGDGNNNPSNGGPYPVFGAGGVQGGYTEYNSENSIIIGHMGDAGCVSWGEGKHFVTYNGTITRPKEEVFTAKFGYYLLSKMNLRQYRGGSGLPFLTYDMLNDMDTIVPTTKSECDKISEFFSTLDQQITLHQRKLEKLKNLKKALLNELFV